MPCMPPMSWTPFMPCLRLGGRDFGHADHGIARDQMRPVPPRSASRVRRTLRQDEVAQFRRAVPDAHLDIFRQFEPELPQARPRIDHGARAICRRLVPDRRQAEESPRVAGAQRTDDQVVHLRPVLDDHDVFALRRLESDLGDRRGGIGKQTLLVGRVNPGPRHHACAVPAGPDFVFVRVDQGVERGRIDQALLYQQRFERLDPESQVVGDRLVLVVMIVSCPLIWLPAARLLRR